MNQQIANTKIHKIDSDWLTIETIEHLISTDTKLYLSAKANADILHCRQYLDDKLANSDQLFYGINTGFGELASQRAAKALEQRCNRNLVVAHAQALDHLPAVDPADVGGVGRGHHHRVHLVGAQRVHRNRQHQGRVDATREPQDCALETVFAQIVAHAQHECVPQLGLGRGQRLDRLVCAGRRRQEPPGLRRAGSHPRGRRPPSPTGTVPHPRRRPSRPGRRRPRPRCASPPSMARRAH